MKKRLYRSKKNKMIAGICGGIAEYTSQDATLVRLLVVLAALLTAIVPFVFIYFISWIIIPDEDKLEDKLNEKSG